MGYEHKPGRGTLFLNDRKQAGSKQPDRTGKINVDGKLWRISGWDENGRISLAVSPLEEQPAQDKQPAQNVAARGEPDSASARSSQPTPPQSRAPASAAPKQPGGFEQMPDDVPW